MAAASFVLVGCSDQPTAPPALETDAAGTSAVSLIPFRLPPWTGCRTGVQPGGALYQICFPDIWNGDVVVWAHGYVAPHLPIAIPDDEIEGTPVADVVTDLGYGYATTSYRRNGLAADVAVLDLEELAGIVSQEAGPRFLLVVGASEGGLATALTLENPATRYDGGLTMCGPVGSFRGQINHFGDFTAVFDYFFPGVVPGDATGVPPEVRENFWTTYEPRIRAALTARPEATAQLLSVTRVPTDAGNPEAVAETVIGLLWYTVFGASDAVARLGGNPFDNRLRWYRGSENDVELNRRITRYAAAPEALAAMEAFETSGAVQRPTQSLHTTGDPIVPWWHQPRYQWKAFAAGTGFTLISVPVDRLGHCAFTLPEALASFAGLVVRVTSRELIASVRDWLGFNGRVELLELARDQGAAPVLVEPEEWEEGARRRLRGEVRGPRLGSERSR